MPAFSGGSALGVERVLWRILAADMNSTADQAFVKQVGFTSYFITRVRAANASTSLSLAAGGLYDTASKGGTPLVAATQVYSGLTGATLGFDLTVAAYGAGLRNGASLFLSLTTGQGGAATMDLYVYGSAVS